MREYIENSSSIENKHNHKLVTPFIDSISLNTIKANQKSLNKALRRDDLRQSIDRTLNTIEFIQNVRTEERVTMDTRKYKHSMS